MIESCPHSAEWETQPGILLPCTVTVTSKSEVQAADEDRGDHSDLLKEPPGDVLEETRRKEGNANSKVRSDRKQWPWNLFFMCMPCGLRDLVCPVTFPRSAGEETSRALSYSAAHSAFWGTSWVSWSPLSN